MEKNEKNINVNLDVDMALIINSDIDKMTNFINDLKEIKKLYSSQAIRDEYNNIFSLRYFNYEECEEPLNRMKGLNENGKLETDNRELASFIINYFDLLQRFNENEHIAQLTKLIDDDFIIYIHDIENYIEYVNDVAGIKNILKIDRLLKRIQELGIRSFVLKPYYPSNDHHTIEFIKYGLYMPTKFDYTDGEIRYIEDDSKDDNVAYEYISSKSNYVLKSLYAYPYNNCAFDFKKCKGTYRDTVNGYETIYVNNLLFEPKKLPKSMKVADTLFVICPMIKNQIEINKIMSSFRKGSTASGLVYSSAKKLLDKLNHGELTKEQREVVKDQIESTRLNYLNTLKMIYNNMDLPGEDIAVLSFKDDGK